MFKLLQLSSLVFTALLFTSCRDVSTSSPDETKLDDSQPYEFKQTKSKPGKYDVSKSRQVIAGREPRQVRPVIKLDDVTREMLARKTKLRDIERAANIINPDGPDDHYFLAVAHLHQDNLGEALVHLERSALYGHPSAQRKLAERYDKGEGVEMNARKAYLYYRLAYTQLKAIESDEKKTQFRDINTRLVPKLSQADLDWVAAEEARHLSEFHIWRVRDDDKRRQSQVSNPPD